MNIETIASTRTATTEHARTISLIRHLATTASLIVVYGWFASQLHAFTVFETATLGQTGLTPSGVGIYNDQFVGAKFELASSVTTTAIGGHFGTTTPIGNNQFFGAIVALSGPNDFPDSADLSTPDVLGTALLTFPNLSAEISAPLSVSLTQGHYALVFGSGLFGATGNGGGATLNNNTIGAPSWISYRPLDNWNVSNLDGARFFVTAIPEPTAAMLLAVGWSWVFVSAPRRRARQI
jgi:hypothetical protein